MTSLCHQSPASSLTICFSGQTGGINYNNTVQSNTTIPNCRSSQCDNKPYKMLGTTLFFFKLELNSGKAETRFAKEQKQKNQKLSITSCICFSLHQFTLYGCSKLQQEHVEPHLVMVPAVTIDHHEGDICCRNGIAYFMVSYIYMVKFQVQAPL